MVIFEDTQLDFSDVLIKPRRSTLSSRKDANIVRTYKFKWCPYEISGTGIVQSNMGTIGNFEVSKKMLKSGLFACLHKHHDIDSLIEFYGGLNEDERHRCFLSIGLKDNGLDKVRRLNQTIFLDYDMSICIDVPNGYIPQVKQLVMDIRKEFPNCLLMVGNVVTGDIVEDLILSGADIVKVGIGNGAQCLQGCVKVMTKNGLVNISEICEGDVVKTHTGEYHNVLTKLCYNFHNEIISINGVKCTPEHKFLVVNKEDIEKINNDNYMEYAYWVEAYALNETTQVLLKIK